ncbi:MAG: UDP-N-acetylglucosamine 2-epimerase (non-hydrolyzing) [Anaerolineae bacterium]|nr:UDP-N-acetylglucosamine 2-epimerase (non-hydrolyzing) [Anaerolineae bacterium]
MKVMTILGTRPEIIRLSRIIARLDQLCEHVLVHTGQNFDRNLSAIFFEQLGVRAPNHYLGVRGESYAEIIGRILIACEPILRQEQPDKLLILGDTNSGLAAIIAKRLGIPVYHMEAGNRCYDDRVPEEINRRIIDHSSDILLPYTERSRANLLREGIPGQNIFVTGNPIHEVLQHYAPTIAASTALQDLGVEPNAYFLVTLHRAENVDFPERLAQFINALERLHRVHGLPVLCSLHPRTRSQLQKQNQTLERPGLHVFEPLGFFDFVKLEQNARCVLSDSGTVQEECCLFRVPNVTLRDVTERPETLEVGSNILSGASEETILSCVETVLAAPPAWQPPPEYLAPDVTTTVVKILCSEARLRLHHP